MKQRALFLAPIVVAACISVPPAQGVDASTGSTTTAGTTDVPTTADATTLDSTSTDPGTTTDPSSSGPTTTSTTTGGPTSTGDGTTGGGTTGSMGDVLFADDFERPNNAQVGNGWLEKSAAAWSIAGGLVVGADGSPTFDDSVVYRPFSEEVADVETTVMFQYTTLPSATTPQLHARIQPGVETPGMETAYLGYSSAADSLTVGAVRDGGLSGTTSVTIAPALEVNVWYRMRFVVQGTDPVQLYAAVEEGSDEQGWTVLAEVSSADTSQDAITSPGSYGFSGHQALTHIEYDNFEAREPG